MAKTAQKTPPPLTQRVHAALLKKGAQSADALARFLRVEARKVSKALSQLKRTGRAGFKLNKESGEALWSLAAKPKRR